VDLWAFMEMEQVGEFFPSPCNILKSDLEAEVKTPLSLPRRPRRVIFNPKIPPNKYEGAKHGLRLQQFTSGMGTHDIVQRMADRGNILHVGRTLRWVLPNATPTLTPCPEKRTWLSMISEDANDEEEEEDIMALGGLLEVYSPMASSSINTPKWRYRKKNKSKDGKASLGSIFIGGSVTIIFH